MSHPPADSAAGNSEWGYSDDKGKYLISYLCEIGDAKRHSKPRQQPDEAASYSAPSEHQEKALGRIGKEQHCVGSAEEEN